MADERILAPIRRFWSKAEVETAYKKVFAASNSRLDEVTVIIGKSTGEDSANAQVVVGREDYLAFMDACEVRLKEYESEEGGENPAMQDTRHVQFCGRYLRT